MRDSYRGDASIIETIHALIEKIKSIITNLSNDIQSIILSLLQQIQKIISQPGGGGKEEKEEDRTGTKEVIGGACCQSASGEVAGGSMSGEVAGASSTGGACCQSASGEVAGGSMSGEVAGASSMESMGGPTRCILVGPSGSGKSSLINTLLAEDVENYRIKKEFEVAGGGESVTKGVITAQKITGNDSSGDILLSELQGLLDPREDSETLELLVDELKHGVHIVMYVLSMGRIYAEERVLLKKILDHCADDEERKEELSRRFIIVVTKAANPGPVPTDAEIKNFRNEITEIFPLYFEKAIQKAIFIENTRLEVAREQDSSEEVYNQRDLRDQIFNRIKEVREGNEHLGKFVAPTKTKEVTKKKPKKFSLFNGAGAHVV